jgi:hypothetical protein
MVVKYGFGCNAIYCDSFNAIYCDSFNAIYYVPMDACIVLDVSTLWSNLALLI